MSDTPTPATPATPPVTPPTADTAPATVTPDVIARLDASIADLRAAVDRQNAAGGARPLSLQERLDEAVRQRDAAVGLRQTSRAITETTDAEVAKLRTKIHTSEVTTAAKAAGFHNPADALALIPADTDDVETAVAMLVKERPYLVRQPAPSPPIGGRNGGAGNPAPGGGPTVSASGRTVDPNVAALAAEIARDR
jgi:hypothetical protein